MGEKEHYLRATLGYEGTTIAREWSICTLTYLDENTKSFVVPNTLNHPLTRDHLIVNNPPYIRSYAAANIFVDRVKVGTLCVCDPAPREFSQREIALLVDMAACVSEMLTSRNKRWIQDHVSGISLSTTILSSIKPPLERVDEDMLSIHDTIASMDISQSPTSLLRIQPDAELLAGCDGPSAPGQATVFDDFSMQRWKRRSQGSVPSRQNELSADNGFDPFVRLEGEVEHLRDGVMRLGKAIDLSLHQMLELSLHGRNAQLSSPTSSSRKSRSRSSSASLAMERPDDTSIALTFTGLPLSPPLSLDSSIESPRSNPDPPHDVRVVRREPMCNQMFDVWIGSHDYIVDGSVATGQRRSRPPSILSHTSQRLHDEDPFAQMSAPLDSFR